MKDSIKKNINKFLPVVFCALLLSFYSSMYAQNPISKSNLIDDIKVLASDSFQGRRPFTIGEKRTIDYLQSTFKQLGLQPGNGKSYLQPVPMVEITPKAAPTLMVTGNGKMMSLTNKVDYVLSTERTDTSINLDKDEVVFAGFGVVAPEYGWNDYAGIDVKGKIVLVMVNDPGYNDHDPSLFKGDTMTYYGRWTYKYEEGNRQGAKAVFIIHNTAAASYPFSVVQSSWGSSNLYLDENIGSSAISSLRGWITEEAANRLLTFAGKDTSVKVMASKKGFKAISLGIGFSTKVSVATKFNTSQNVIGKIAGSKYPNEYIIYTAHWDHFGIGKPDANGDSIYNGAYDNASGTAALIEMARAFKNLKTPPLRSILFLAVTGEEQGLLGSAYYGRHPIYPVARTVANINMDGINPFGKTTDIVIAGQGQSDLEDIIIKQAALQGRHATPEPDPQGGHYFRSDHFSFAKVGIPAVDMGWGTNFVGHPASHGKKIKDDYRAKHYHQPSDQFDPSWTFEGGLQDVQLLFNAGKYLAFNHYWPKWKPGSEFKKLRQ